MKNKIMGKGREEITREMCLLTHPIPRTASHVCASGLSEAHADRQELRSSAVNTIVDIVGHVSEVPVARSSRRSATEIRPARHRPDLGKTRVSRSSIRRNASRGATSPTRSISEKSTTFRLSLRLNRVHSTGLALPRRRRGKPIPDRGRGTGYHALSPRSKVPRHLPGD